MPEKGSADPPSHERELQRWWKEHSELDRLVEVLTETMSGGRMAAARAALEDLFEAMEAHLSVEEDVYFPLVEKLAHAHIPLLREARLAHLELRGNLEEMRDHLSQGELDAARRALVALLDRFREHEQTEARLIADLELASA
jgi:hemerythrin